MSKLILTKGIPGCGKSYWAEQYVKNAKRKTIIVNLDDLRDMITGNLLKYKYNKASEKLISNTQMVTAENALLNGMDVIVADTNMNPTVIQKWYDLSKSTNSSFEIVDFFEMFKENQVEKLPEYFMIKKYVDLCKKQNIMRLHSVPEDVIDRFADTLYCNLDIPLNDVGDEAIIVDIDGTVAQYINRSPYDETKVIDDSPQMEIIKSIQAEKYYLGRKIIFVSGRHETCKEDTIAWLKIHNVPFDGLIYMRGALDNRPDDIVKHEIYMNHIQGKYKICKVYDDRDKVVKMWRTALGLRTLQVANGNF